MDVFNSLWLGLGVAMQPMNLLFCFAGVFIGTLIGVLPGIGPVAAMSLLLPIYCTWAIWSLLNILKFGDDEAMIMAGFVPQVPPLCHPSQPIPSHENLPSPSPSPLNLVLSHCRALRRFCGGEWYKAMVAEKAIILMS